MLDLRRTPEPLPRAAGWAVCGVLVAFVALGTAHRLPDRPALTLLGAAIAVIFGVVTIIGPRAALIPAVLAATAGTVLLGNGDAANVGWFAFCVLGGVCVLVAPRWFAGSYWLLAVLVLFAELAFTVHDPGWAAWLTGTTFTVVGCALGAYQRDLVVQLRAAQAGLTAQAQTEERNRIARELHDVIAHSLTVSLMHVTSARLAVRDDPADAERALAEAERLGRASLDEVRHVVGLSRGDGRTTPLPAGADLPALIEQFRGAGADVRASFDGDLAAVPGTAGLAAYRIVQESLTNASKHAPRAQATVHVAVGPSEIELDVDSAGTPGDGAGLGLLGMRERAHALGGTCEAGPGGSGWRVHARLPLDTA